MRWLVLGAGLGVVIAGCSMLPQKIHEPRFYNPFPQLSRIAVVPFFNQSDEPTLDGFAVANAYRNELQKIPGFEVMPVGVVEQLLLLQKVELNQATDFQQLAQALGVDVVVVGSVTDFDQYYPPRMGLAVNWYAASPMIHPIPPGSGLPWGTADEEFIPESLIYEAEFALAREKLKAETPPLVPIQTGSDMEGSSPAAEQMTDWIDSSASTINASKSNARNAEDQKELPPIQSLQTEPRLLAEERTMPRGIAPLDGTTEAKCTLFHGPIIQLVRQYNGHDADFVERLANYFWFRHDARFGGWQSYLQRKDDFISFCCYLHITEMLAARGGAGQTRVVWRRRNDRYQ